MLLQVQKKLQMRIEAQGKYLQGILEKAQTNLSLDMNSSSANLEATRTQLTNFNLALSNLMDNLNENEANQNISDLGKFHGIDRNVNADTYMGGGRGEEKKDVKLKVEGGDSMNFDLNMRGSYDFFRQL